MPAENQKSSFASLFPPPPPASLASLNLTVKNSIGWLIKVINQNLQNWPIVHCQNELQNKHRKSQQTFRTLYKRTFKAIFKKQIEIESIINRPKILNCKTFSLFITIKTPSLMGYCSGPQSLEKTNCLRSAF